MAEKNEIKKKQLNKIHSDHIELYLKLWMYDGVTFGDEGFPISNLKEKVEKPGIEQKNTLEVTNQAENNIVTSHNRTYGIEQLLYELEVLADIPDEIREKIDIETWIEFIIRFIAIWEEKGYKVCFSKQMPLTDAIEERIRHKVVMDYNSAVNHEYGKCFVLQNGNGGSVSDYISKNKENKKIMVRRFIILFRAYIMELLYEHFRSICVGKDVSIYALNWQWALDNPLYPYQNPTTKDLEERAQYTINNIINNERQYLDFLREIYGSDFDLNYIREIMDIPNRLQMDKGSVIHEDKVGKYLNVLQGERKTTNQPSDYDNTIYLIGGCVFFGYAVEDSQTIASYLQRKFNEHNKKWRVVNYGTWGGDFDWTYQSLYQIDFKPGDMVLISYAGYMPLGREWKKYDISTALKQVDTSKEFYFNAIVHCNKLGYEKIADSIYAMFKDDFQRWILSKEVFRLERKQKSQWIYQEHVDEYIADIRDSLPALSNKTVGSIVMNCNPFTLGHQYLIEYAASRVDVLIIFVVEENKSFFKFEDRIELVKKGTKHISNVYVIPSGRMIISTVTFPGYFLKDTPDKANLDTSLDVMIFGKYIAPRLNIKLRFVGEEPLDIVTQGYNQNLKKVLPDYGINVIEIPRKTKGASVISASLVRKYLEDKRFDEIMELVPHTTYQYLVDRYNV